MDTYLKDIFSILSDIVAILAFLWAVYEFYIKRRFKIKATAFPNELHKNNKEYIFTFSVINLSEQSLNRINSIGIWIKRKNSFGAFWEIKLQDIGYQEKITFFENILPFLISAIEQCIEEQTWIDKLFTPKLKIVLRTANEREINVIIDEFYHQQVNEKINKLFNKNKK